MPSDLQAMETAFVEGIKKSAGSAIWLGVGLALMGLICMATPLIAGLYVAIIVGIAFIFGGIAKLVFAFRTGKGFWAIVVGGLTALLGVYMVANPGVALASLTLLLAAYFLAAGISEGIFAFHIRPAQGWGWELFNAAVSVLLGGLIWAQFPFSDVWAVGLLLGIKLAFSGWTLIMLGMAAKKAAKQG